MIRAEPGPLRGWCAPGKGTPHRLAASWGRRSERETTHPLGEHLRYGRVASTHPGMVVETRRAGLEPATFGLEIRCSIRLSYRRWRLRNASVAAEGVRWPSGGALYGRSVGREGTPERATLDGGAREQAMPAGGWNDPAISPAGPELRSRHRARV